MNATEHAAGPALERLASQQPAGCGRGVAGRGSLIGVDNVSTGPVCKPDKAPQGVKMVCQVQGLTALLEPNSRYR